MIKKILGAIFLASLMVAWLEVKDVGAAFPEASHPYQNALNNFPKLNCAQFNYDGQYPQCTGTDICWNSPSIINSTADLESTLGIDLSVAMGGNGGDVRYRCLRQKGVLYCFAFRCTQPDPAPCTQMWRIENISRPGQCRSGGSICGGTSKCFDVGGYNAVCDSGRTPAAYTCP